MSCYTKLDIVYERYIDYKCVYACQTKLHAWPSVYTRRHACFCACDMRVRRMSHSFSVELVAGLYHIIRIINKAI